MVTVNEMFNYATKNNMMLLSNFPALFWSDYRNNNYRYDNAFNRLYKSFRYFLQNDEDVSEVTVDFIEQVYNHLLLNEKKYSELYRINVISDDDYSLKDNYNITETMDRDTTDVGGETEGNRTDSTVTGSRTDISSNGERIDTNSYTKGQQSNGNVNKVSPYDSELFFNDTQIDSTEGQRIDSGSMTKGSETDTFEKGSQTDSFVKGAQINSYDKTGTEDYTLNRVGNIGVKSVTNMLDEANKFWTPFEFYTMIFGDICRELLLV